MLFPRMIVQITFLLFKMLLLHSKNAGLWTTQVKYDKYG